MQKWDDDLYLFTPEELEKIPEGTILTCIDTENYTKGKDHIVMNTRFGYTAFGVRDPWNHPLKDLFLIFKLVE